MKIRNNCVTDIIDRIKAVFLIPKDYCSPACLPFPHTKSHACCSVPCSYKPALIQPKLCRDCCSTIDKLNFANTIHHEQQIKINKPQLYFILRAVYLKGYASTPPPRINFLKDVSYNWLIKCWTSLTKIPKYDFKWSNVNNWLSSVYISIATKAACEISSVMHFKVQIVTKWISWTRNNILQRSTVYSQKFE